ncbi:unnamed protein product, partial [Rhizoctonia solani]
LFRRLECKSLVVSISFAIRGGGFPWISVAVGHAAWLCDPQITHALFYINPLPRKKRYGNCSSTIHFRPTPMCSSGDVVNANEEYQLTHLEWVFYQLWYIEPIQVPALDTYSVRNLAHGSYLCLDSGSNANGTRVQGWNTVTCSNEQWRIRQVPDSDAYRIQNVTSGTFADLLSGGAGHSRNLPIVGWAGAWENNTNHHQLWCLKKTSLPREEIRELLTCYPSIQEKFFTCFADGEYFILHPETIQRIWAESELGQKNYHWRREIFDCDDFAYVLKAEVTKWAARNIKADVSPLDCLPTFSNDYPTNLSGILRSIRGNGPQTGKVVVSIIFFTPRG